MNDKIRLSSIQQVFSFRSMTGSTNAAVFRLKKNHEAYARNRENIDLGRTDWWDIAEDRLRSIDAIVLLIDSQTSGLVEVYSGIYSGEFLRDSDESSRRKALFAEGGFSLCGVTYPVGLHDFCGKNLANQATYVEKRKVAAVSRPANVKAIGIGFEPRFKPEFVGEKSAVLPRSFKPRCHHAKAINRLHESLLRQGYREIHNYPWDMSALSPQGKRVLFELKPDVHPTMLHAAVGQLLIYAYEFEQKYQLVHDRLVVVLPDEASARWRAGMLHALGIGMMVYSDTYEFTWVEHR